MDRRDFLKASALGGAGMMAGVPAALASPAPAASSAAVEAAAPPPFEHEEATLASLQALLSSGRETAVTLAQKYLDRIQALDQGAGGVHAVIELNPDALEIARALDAERAARGPRGPLHGIPVMLKDNIDTHDKMMCTAGSLALLGSRPPRDAFLARRLRDAGALILAKTNLSEWANFRGNRSSSGWSARGGQTNNPYALDRNPSGSSSGSAAAVSANFCAVAVGTETDGSIVSPASVCGVVGLKPTVGLVSRSGIIPISQSQDTAGPMGRTVTDVAILLGALCGTDPLDPATAAAAGRIPPDYTRFLDPAGLKGARLGVLRSSFNGRGGLTAQLIDGALAELKSAGATLVDPVSLPRAGGLGAAEATVMSYEFKAGLNAYLAALGPAAPVHTMQEIIDFNEKNKEAELKFFGQEQFLAAIRRGPLTDQAYLDALALCRRTARGAWIDALMDQHKLDAIVGLGGGPAGTTDLIYGDRDVGGSSTAPAVAGYPNITVPAGLCYGMPVGLCFFGRAWSEGVLLKIAFAFEQATRARRKPCFLKTLA